MKSISRELIGALAVPIILLILKQGDNYGYEIVQRVKETTNGEINWNEPSIYPVLKKLEGNGFIKSYWKVERNERPRNIIPYFLMERNNWKKTCMNGN